MRKLISLALVAIAVALPAPASQMPAAAVAAGPDATNFRLMLADPFLIDALSYAPPRSLRDAM